MSERRPGPESPANGGHHAVSHPTGELPPPDAVAFIRHCYRRRGVGWPELYDEMCAVASSREFNGWDHAELAARGIAFSLPDMPRLAGWVRAVLAAEAAQQRHASVTPVAATTPGAAQPSSAAAL